MRGSFMRDLEDMAKEKAYNLIRNLNNETPGPDGIPHRAYAILGPSVGPFFVSCDAAPLLLKEGHIPHPEG